MDNIGMDFYEALKQVNAGRRVTRLDWKDQDTFILLRDGFLSIYRDGKYHQLLTSDGDMNATDWVLADGPIN